VWPQEHPVHGTVTKTYRHLNFFQHEGLLQVRTPRVKLAPRALCAWSRRNLPAASRACALLFEALVLMLARQMPFAALTRSVGISPRTRPCRPARRLRRTGNGGGRAQQRGSAGHRRGRR
jgi:hypothetical protein